MRPERFATFLERALGAIAAEAPAAHARLRAILRDQAVALGLDDEPLVLRGAPDGSGIQIQDGATQADCRLVTTRRHLLGLLDGEDTLLAALLAERVGIVGPAALLAVLFEALSVFVQGAVRSAAMPDLLQEFRAGADAPSPREGTANEPGEEEERVCARRGHRRTDGGARADAARL